MELEASLEIAKKYLDRELFNSLSLVISKDNNQVGVQINKKGDKVEIKYDKLNNLFRALTYIKEHKNKENYVVALKPCFETNGFMIDCSRNGVVKVENIKKIVLMMALMGLNRLLLYTEDTYEMEKYPYFGYLRGAYSKEELKEMVSYADSFGVTIVPCIQTLDHLERPLRWEVFDSIKDGASNLMVNDEKSYEFIEVMIKTSRECFTSNTIHIGMDESFGMGLGRFLGKYGYQNRVELFCKHLSRVIAICKKYNFEPAIWSDMFFRLNDPNNEYYGGKPLPKETLDLIPEGIELVYWDYYHEDKKIYDNMIVSHLETHRKVSFAGGAWKWSGFAPSLHKSFEFSNAALQSCVEHNLKNVFVTAWGDNGNECSQYTSLLILAQYSTFSYFGECKDDVLDSLLNAVTGETKERMLLLDLPNMPDKKVLAATYNPSKYFFYQDVLLGMFDDQVKENFASNYKEFSSILLKASKESKNYSNVYLNLSNLCSVLEIKVDLGVRLRKAYKANDKKTLKEICEKDFPELIVRLEQFYTSLQKQWNDENKRFGFEILDGRIGFLKQRICSALMAVNNYLDGKLDKIEELEVEILPYNGHDFEICWNQWTTTVSPSGI